MRDRRVSVLICASGQRVELDGAAASLVALVATTSLSPRTLSALVQLAANEPFLAPIAYDTLEVVLAGSQAKIFHRTRLPRRPVGLPQEDSDVA